MFEHDFIRRLREQSDQLERIARKYDFGELAGSMSSARLAIEQFRTSGIFDSLARSADQLREFSAMDGVVQRAAKQVEELSGTFDPALADFAALRSPLHDFQIQLRASTVFTDMASHTLHSVDFDSLGLLLSTAQLPRDRVKRATGRLARTHARLIGSLPETDPKPPTFVAELPSVELFAHAEAVRAITPHEESDADDRNRNEAHDLNAAVVESTAEFVERTLSELKPAFREQFLGIRQCAVTKGPDWWSQGAASMRKLVKGVLHTVAADHLVLPYVTRPTTQLDRNGHPTRAAKIAWLCQRIRNDEYRAFVLADLTAAVALIDLLDAANHKDEFPDFEMQYATVALRVEVTIRHLLTLWKARNTD